MDKFGVFKLLNSVFSQAGKSPFTASEPNNPTDGAKNNGNSNFMNGILSLLSSLNNTNNTPSKEPTTRTSVPERAYLPPLQSSMISTMKNHELIEKRVKQNANKPNKV